MIRRSVRSLDELDKVEENERREAEAREQELALAATIADLESAQAIDESAVLLPLGFWDDPGFVPETQQASQGS